LEEAALGSPEEAVVVVVVVLAPFLPVQGLLDKDSPAVQEAVAMVELVVVELLLQVEMVQQLVLDMQLVGLVGLGLALTRHGHPPHRLALAVLLLVVVVAEVGIQLRT
jgi:hypothetical protein